MKNQADDLMTLYTIYNCVACLWKLSNNFREKNNIKCNMLQFHENSSFEAKNITCDFLHENSLLAIEISKNIFPDYKKCKKVQESSLKRLFCIF